jgi:hypothetical protein
MSARAHTALRLAAIAWIAVMAWIPRGGAVSAKTEQTVQVPAAHAFAPHYWGAGGVARDAALARR